MRTTQRHRDTAAVIAEIGEHARAFGFVLAALDEAREALAHRDVVTAEMFASLAAVELRRMLEGDSK